MSMLVVVTENVPARWHQVTTLADEGNVVMAWAVNNESGFDFQTWGENRRMAVELDGLRLVSFHPS